MPNQSNDDLARARGQLTIFRVWEIAASEGAIVTIGQSPRRDGLYKSPFRDDKRRGSFSICYGGKGFKDHGGDGITGDVWKFAALCWPNLNEAELANKYIEMSGITRTPRPVRNDAQPGAAAPAPVDPNLLKAAKALAKRNHVRQLEDAIYDELEAQLGPKAAAKDVPKWPAVVGERYNEGWRVLRGAVGKMSELAKARGWPTEWVLELIVMGLISYPLERWIDPSDAVQRRQKAFVVQLPVITIEGEDAHARADLKPVGYHQRWFVPGKGREGDIGYVAAQKGWLYVPCVPNKPKSNFEKYLTEYGAEQGVTLENKHGLFPPLPFVMGDLGAAKVIVLLEGQWDAITFFGACGYFQDANPPVGIAVFGIRGAQGLDVFLNYWAKWLRVNRPLAWIIADNDKAGQSWLKAPPAKEGLPRSPTFAERLEFVGCRDVKTSWLKPGDWGKDFNDYYRAAKPGPDKMAGWMRKVGVMQENGEWA